MTLSRDVTITAVCGAIAIASGRATFAQQAATVPPVRQLGRRLAVTQDTLGTISGIRQLSDGRVIVNDVKRHQLLLYDSTLSHATVIADSTSSTKKAYGAARGGLIAYRGDTTLLVDPIALSLLVIDPHGTIVRTIAPPRPSDAPALIGLWGPAGVDAAARLVYRDIPGAFCGPNGGCGARVPPARDTTGDAPSTLPPYARHDSVAILRGDIARHVIDTVGFIAVPLAGRSDQKQTNNPDGSYTVTQTMTVSNLLPMVDDWAAVADGAVAFVRGQDYHVDWVNADGSRTSTPRIAHDWHRLSDSEKTWIIDSVKRVVDSATHADAAVQDKANSINKANGRPVIHSQMVYTWPQPSELADYRPVLVPGTVKADADDNLWIQRNYSPLAGGPPPTYDIVNRQGRLTDRVQLPPSLTLAGFGPGVVYLTSREGRGTLLLKYRIR